MICLSLLVLLSVASQQFAVADPLGEFCANASTYLMSEVRTRGYNTRKDLESSLQSGMDKAESSLKEWRAGSGKVIFEGLPGDRKAAQETLNRWFAGAGDKFVEAQKSVGARLQDKPLKPADISNFGTRLNSRASDWFKSAGDKVRQFRDESCAIVLMHEAELKRMHSQVEGLTVALESIPSSRLECLAVVTNQRLATQCRGSGAMTGQK